MKRSKIIDMVCIGKADGELICKRSLIQGHGMFEIHVLENRRNILLHPLWNSGFPKRRKIKKHDAAVGPFQFVERGENLGVNTKSRPLVRYRWL